MPQTSATLDGSASNSFSGIDANLSPQRMQALIGRIAIYPDELLGLVLTASTQPLEIIEAHRFLEMRKTHPTAKPPETWDPSVFALLNYPDVVALMDSDLTWTEQLGTSVIDQRAALLDAIQSFRRQAYKAGALRSNDKVTVTVSSGDAAQDQDRDETIAISPTQPQVLYVPIYDPEAIVAPAPNYDASPYPYEWSPAYQYYGDPDAIFFSPDLWIGGIIGFSFDWHAHHIFRGDEHREIFRADQHRDRFRDDRDDGHHLAPGAAIHGHSIWAPDQRAVQQAQAGFTARDPAGVRPAMAAAGFGHSLTPTIARPTPQIAHGGAPASSPSSVQAFRATPAIHNGASVQVFRGTPAIHNGAAMPHPSFAAPRFAGGHFGAPIGAARGSIVAPTIHSGMAHSGIGTGGNVTGSSRGGGGRR
jgi:hypothetical protein